MASVGHRVAWRGGGTVSQSIQCRPSGFSFKFFTEAERITFDQEWVEALSFYHFLATGTVVTYSQVMPCVTISGAHHLLDITHCKLQVKGELEWTVGKWAGVPVRPGIAHWERREREGKEGGGPPTGAAQGEGNRASVVEGDEKIEDAIRAVSLSQEGEKVAMATQESLKPEEESQVPV